ncbi:hypothetical protein ID866_11642 [Astraeus odoratus]|nr:hypothetical protein ID866_11642 [Astraeus odoratus]
MAKHLMAVTLTKKTHGKMLKMILSTDLAFLCILFKISTRMRGNPILVIIDCSGHHYLLVRLCQCSNAPEMYIQLLHAGLYPASQKSPHTAFTFQVLDDFRIENLESKIPDFTYSQKLRRITYPTFPHFAPGYLRCSFFSSFYNCFAVLSCMIATEN